MCFGSCNLKGPAFEEDVPPARIASRETTESGAKNDTSDLAKEDSRSKNREERSYNDGYGDSMGLDLFAQRQERLREAYPDGNIPQEVQKFNESGMVQGNLGGPVGSGAGMALSAGF